MAEPENPVPNGLKLARNIAAAAGAVMLLLGLLLQAAGESGQIPLWIGMLCLATAVGISLVTTQWRAMSVGTAVVVAIATGALLLVVVDLL